MTPRPLGNSRDAERALMGTMEYIAKGAFRKVYINRDRTIVYKVCIGDDNDLYVDIDEANWAEYNNYWAMRRHGFRCMAYVYLWCIQFEGRERVVIAQRYYCGPRDDNLEALLACAMEKYVPDIDYGGNIQFTKRGKPIITDIQLYDPSGRNIMVFATRNVQSVNREVL